MTLTSNFQTYHVSLTNLFSGTLSVAGLTGRRLTSVGVYDGLLVVGKGVRGADVGGLVGTLVVGADVGLSDGFKKVIGESLGDFFGFTNGDKVGEFVGSGDSGDEEGELVGSEVIGTSSLVITLLFDGEVVGSTKYIGGGLDISGTSTIGELLLGLSVSGPPILLGPCIPEGIAGLILGELDGDLVASSVRVSTDGEIVG